MVFSSLIFLTVFLPFNLALYFVWKNRTYRNAVLIIFSLAFYAWGEPIWITLLLFSSFFDFFNALIVEHYRGNWQSKAALLSSLIVNLSLLAFFKYSGFLIVNINYIFGTNLLIKTYALPLGISFYTFQTISYVIDVYRGEVEAQKSPLKLLLYISLFHQLVAGPIVRYKDIAREIENRVITTHNFSQGINRFVTGLAKKVLIANPCGEAADLLLKGDFTQLSVLGAWLGILMFAFQIYFDFSGYSDMAIGLGKMFGLTYKENFNYPYIARSATEFWRRWHISLGSFFKDYVYIPLGGNRKFPFRNLLIVWFLTGLWHGASWNFVLWGVFFGGLIMLEKAGLAKILEELPRVISHLYLIAAVLISWVLFYYTDLGKAFGLLKIMFGHSVEGLTDTLFSAQLSNNIWLLLIAALASTPVLNKLGSVFLGFKPREQGDTFYRERLRSLVNISILITCIILLVGQTYNPFLYFRF